MRGTGGVRQGQGGQWTSWTSRVHSPAIVPLLLLLTLTLFALPASAEVVRHRVKLPMFMGVDVAPLAGEGDGPVRIRVSGTMSSSVDGSEIDAVSRRADGTTFEVDGPFLRLPRGAQLVEADVGAHRYIYELPRRRSLPVGVNLTPLAVRNLVTYTELAASCTGAFEVEVFGPPLLPVGAREGTGGTAATSSGRQTAELIVLGLFFALLLPVAGIGALVRRRRRLRPELGFVRRSRLALRAVEREALVLGPAFGHVVTSSGQLVHAAQQGLAHLEATRAALRRTRTLLSPGASSERAELAAQGVRILESLSSIAERLEATAAGLARRRAGQSSSETAAAELLAALEVEVDAAVAATREAGLNV